MSKKFQALKNDIATMSDEEFCDMIWHMESCEEAIEMLEVFYECPVCGELANREGVIFHKNPKTFKKN